MVNYQDGKIYKIVDNTNGNVYIGSTCKKLSSRLADHRADYKKYLNGNSHFVSSFKILENNDFDIILIEKWPCDDKEELHKQERFYIETFECVNKNIPTRTSKEYYKDNKQQIKEYREKTKQQRKEYRDTNKDRIKETTREEYKSNKATFFRVLQK